MTLEKEILIADSGATKTDWCLTKNGEIIQRFPTKGISPVFQTGEEITQEIRSHVYPELKDAGIKAIYFYGAGCIPEKTELVREAIHQSFPVDTIHVHSDLVAAAQKDGADHQERHQREDLDQRCPEFQLAEELH